MIAKKIKLNNPKSTNSKVKIVSDLVSYIGNNFEDAGVDNSGKVAHFGARNFLSDQPHVQMQEMAALALESTRTRNPINHYIISWQPDEQPTIDQVEQAVTILHETLGLEGHQSMYGLHTDTDNVHLHFAVNRVNPQTYKVTEINKGFDLEKLHEALAKIEHAQGWKSEKNARYQVLENGDIVQRAREKKVKSPSTNARNFENYTGEKSAQRRAIDNAAPIIDTVSSWRELHDQFAQQGMAYKPRGGGAVILVDDIPIKASSVSRSASLTRLEQRLGKYQAAAPDPDYSYLPDPVSELLYPAPGLDVYAAQRKQADQKKQDAKRLLEERQEAEKQALKKRQEAEREETLRGNWKGRGPLLNALRKRVAAGQKIDTDTLKKLHQAEREALKRQHPAFPSYEEWLRAHNRDDIAEVWRHRVDLMPKPAPLPVPVETIDMANPPDPLAQFARYAHAVGADRYRVTSIKMQPDGRKMTFILDKKDGITTGFTPAEIVSRTPEMLRLQARGENLYYTPLSAAKHHILIDDMDRTKLDRLIADGYQPAVLLESSPGNYQAVVTIPKLGTPHDRDVGNRLTERLNRAYGDEKLSGAIHPHRAPGFENRKPKHQQPDGSYPAVRLLKAEARECILALELSRQINADYEQTAQKRQAKPAPQVAPVAAPTGTAADAYKVHFADVVARQKGEIDLSRVDAMVAVRMRVTGHSRGDIEASIATYAPTVRDNPEGRNWTQYAQRTTDYAHSYRGDQQTVELAKYSDQWRKLEGQPAPVTPVQSQDRRPDRTRRRDDDSPDMGF